MKFYEELNEREALTVALMLDALRTQFDVMIEEINGEHKDEVSDENRADLAQMSEALDKTIKRVAALEELDSEDYAMIRTAGYAAIETAKDNGLPIPSIVDDTIKSVSFKAAMAAMAL